MANDFNGMVDDSSEGILNIVQVYVCMYADEEHDCKYNLLDLNKFNKGFWSLKSFGKEELNFSYIYANKHKMCTTWSKLSGPVPLKWEKNKNV